MKSPRARALALLLPLCATTLLTLLRPARAHQVWLEPEGAGSKLYFGEFGLNLHEVSPGYLDKLARPSATLLTSTGDESVGSRKDRDGIFVVGGAARGQALIAVDPAYPLLESRDGAKLQKTAWTPAARYMPELALQAPKLTLDAVPTRAVVDGSGEFLVTYRGAPLAKAEVTLVASSGWSLSATTDPQGKVSFRLPWKGTYALLVRHKDPTPGKRKNAEGAEEAFDAASFATTLTFAVQSGLPSPPRPPAAAPNTP